MKTTWTLVHINRHWYWGVTGDEVWKAQVLKGLEYHTRTLDSVP